MLKSNAERARSRQHQKEFRATMEPTRFPKPGKGLSAAEEKRRERRVRCASSPRPASEKSRIRRSIGRVGFETKKTRNRSEVALLARLFTRFRHQSRERNPRVALHRKRRVFRIGVGRGSRRQCAQPNSKTASRHFPGIRRGIWEFAIILCR